MQILVATTVGDQMYAKRFDVAVCPGAGDGLLVGQELILTVLSRVVVPHPPVKAGALPPSAVVNLDAGDVSAAHLTENGWSQVQGNQWP